MTALPRSLAVLAIGAALVLSGCASKDDAPGKADAGESPATTTPAPTETPTETPTPTPAASPSPATLTDRLLPTGDVPGLNATWEWQDGLTGPAPGQPFETCSRASLLDIGATEAVSRSYFPPDDSDDNAGQQVAEFPDAKTATGAWSVLAAWRARCGAGSSSESGPHPGTFVTVPVGNGVARWYLVTIGGPQTEDGRFSAIGMIRTGNRISVLHIDNSGQDYDYPRGQEPMVAMLEAAAELLG